VIAQLLHAQISAPSVGLVMRQRILVQEPEL